jgi:predicted metal-dependent hydrolase
VSDSRDPGRDAERTRGRSPHVLQAASPSRRLEKGLELIRAGEYFAAHEELEDAWRAAPPEERDFLQGLVHVAVAWYQAGRGRRIGTERQLAKAIRRLQPYAPAHRGVELEPLLAQLRDLHERGKIDLPAPQI